MKVYCHPDEGGNSPKLKIMHNLSQFPPSMGRQQSNL
jgi:hypothetical protein